MVPCAMSVLWRFVLAEGAWQESYQTVNKRVMGALRPRSALKQQQTDGEKNAFTSVNLAERRVIADKFDCVVISRT
jgi:hypothetical protein